MNPAFPLIDAMDIAIIMHREVHFGGKFDVMMEYYENEGRGIQQEFDLQRIEELRLLEQQMKQNLASLMLSGPDAERIAEAKKAYDDLKKIYSGPPSPANQLSRMIADLILAEKEELHRTFQAVIDQKNAIVPSLIELVKSENFHDPLFPGYGLAPSAAVQCLGKIGDKRAIIALFESIGEDDFISDDFALHALKQIGEPAKAFLLKVLHGDPVTYDNERAAVALLEFKEDPEVAKAAFEKLQTLNFKRDFLLATQLVLVCEGLKEEQARKQFRNIATMATTPKMLQQDMQMIIKIWDK